MKTKGNIIQALAIILFAALAAAASASANGKPKPAEKIVYFEQNGKFGAKTAGGKIIVPAQYDSGMMIRHGDTAEGELIFMDSGRAIKGKVAYSPFFLHSRQGRLLYQPMMYDMVPDYFSEGKRRYVAPDGKVGFADRAGKLVIPAKHDWAGQFEYGYAEFCDGCREVRVDEEHTAVRGGTWGVMDAHGNTVSPGNTRRTAADIERNGKFYPHPFAYTAAERDILNRIGRYKNLIVGLDIVSVSPRMPPEQRAAYRLEIVSRPVAGYPYYEIALFDDAGRNVSDKYFLAGADGKRLYALPGEDVPQPLETYLRRQIRTILAEQPERQKSGFWQDNPFVLKDYPEAEALLKKHSGLK
ncbi:MAG: WG repeat-containing protein [Neisseria sp.]|nr:WG repeat-containing protein [Neisseria sp.]